MEDSRFRPVASITDPLPGRSSHLLTPTPMAPVSNKSLSFSISAILGLEDDPKHQDLPNNETTTQCSELRVHIPSPPHNYSDATTQLSLCSDNTSSTSNCNSEPDQVSPHVERPARKKRKRTTFSPIEVWELERVYKRRGPYLMSTDEEELVQRLGISARSLKHWFQNRRAKSRKEEAHSASIFIHKANPSSQFGTPVSRLPMESWQPRRPQFPVSHTRHLAQELLAVQSNRSEQFYRTLPASVNNPSAFKPTQSRRCRSFKIPMFHPNQFNFRPVAKVETLSYQQEFYRYKPY